MPIRIIAREPRLDAALKALEQCRSRAFEFPSTVLERQRRDWRVKRFDSTKPAAVIASVAAVSEGGGVEAASTAAGGAYYGGGGGGAGGGGGGAPF